MHTSNTALFLSQQGCGQSWLNRAWNCDSLVTNAARNLALASSFLGTGGQNLLFGDQFFFLVASWQMAEKFNFNEPCSREFVWHVCKTLITLSTFTEYIWKSWKSCYFFLMHEKVIYYIIIIILLHLPTKSGHCRNVLNTVCEYFLTSPNGDCKNK